MKGLEQVVLGLFVTNRTWETSSADLFALGPENIHCAAESFPFLLLSKARSQSQPCINQGMGSFLA